MRTLRQGCRTDPFRHVNHGGLACSGRRCHFSRNPRTPALRPQHALIRPRSSSRGLSLKRKQPGAADRQSPGWVCLQGPIARKPPAYGPRGETARIVRTVRFSRRIIGDPPQEFETPENLRRWQQQTESGVSGSSRRSPPRPQGRVRRRRTGLVRTGPAGDRNRAHSLRIRSSRICPPWGAGPWDLGPWGPPGVGEALPESGRPPGLRRMRSAAKDRYASL